MNEVTHTLQSTDFRKEFEEFNRRFGKKFQSLRTDGIAFMEQHGFPSAKNEDWKYFNLRPVLEYPVTLLPGQEPVSFSSEQLKPLLKTGNNSLVFVFINGRFRSELSSDIPVQQGCKAKPFSQMEEGEFKMKPGSVSNRVNAPFVVLNDIFHSDGFYFELQDNTDCLTPIHILHISSGQELILVNTFRTVFNFGKKSKAQVITTFHSIHGDQPSLVNVVNEISVGAGAMVEFDNCQTESEATDHFNHTFVRQERDSVFDVSTVTLGGNRVRNILQVLLDGTNCTSHLYGLYVGNKNQVIDNRTLVDHAHPFCQSNELYKGLLGGQSHGIFNGRIMVRQDAQKTNAFQSSKTVLLNDGAVMNAKPQLEIFADDVKCSHGATTGQLDEEALFYLRQRGIGENDARALLNFAFASDVLKNINNLELRNHLLVLLAGKLNSKIEFSLS